MEFESFALSRQQARAWSLAGRGTRIDRAVQVVAPIGAATTAESVETAVLAAVERHEILRTTYAIPAGRVDGVQLVHASLAPAIRALPGVVVATVLDDERRPFAIDESPLRVAVVAAGTTDAAVVVTLPAIAADAASAARLAHEIVDPSHVVADPLQYADYAAWQEDRLAGASAGPAAAYPPAATEVRMRLALVPGGDGAAPSVHESRVTVTVECDIAAVRAAASRLGCADREVVLAAWFVWLARTTNDADVPVAVLHDGRAHSEIAGALGPFSRYVATTADADPDMPFADIVATVHDAAGSPDEWVEVVPDPSVAVPAFAALDSLGPGVRITTAVTADRPDVELRWLGSGIELLVTDRLPAEVSGALARSFGTLLAAAITDPTARGGDLPTLADADRAAVVAQATGPAREPVTATFIECFEAQVARTPDQCAARRGADRLTYSELDARANQLARVLVDHGVARGARVGVLIDRSPAALVAILGILKTGAAYVPLNAEHPVARLTLQLEDAGVTVVVTVAEVAARVPAGRRAIVLDGAEVTAGVDASPFHTNDAIALDDPVYVLYTSGSTGTPKGVVVTHANLASYATSVADLLVEWAGVARGTPLRCGVVTSISTDLANTCMYPPLLSGGCVDFVPAEVAIDPFRFAAHRREHPVDVLKITPSHLRALVQAGGADVLPAKVLVVGGEALSWDLIATVHAAAPALTIVNHYGPTETTIGACTFVVPAEAGPSRSATVPIGRPLPGVTCDIVDRAGQLVGDGVPGELLIGGVGVAAGYCGAEVATGVEARFVADSLRLGARVYRTGDVVRRLPDGALEFLGRTDDQVKIRGHRVEPGEIERLLAQVPAVRNVAVVVREGAGHDTILVAFVVPDHDGAGGAVDAFALRESLAARVPEYMIPAAFVTLDALPLTASGKLDRRALPDHTAAPGTGAGAQAVHRAPTTETEALLVAAWAEILGIDEVGVDDDFFALGGHSLLATQVIARARHAVGVELPLYALFTAPTVAQLAVVVDELVARSGGTVDGGDSLADDEELAALLDGMSDEEIERLLAEE